MATPPSPVADKPVFGCPIPKTCSVCGYPFDHELKRAHKDKVTGLWVCNALRICETRARFLNQRKPHA